jgi:HD-like signal output (HDOD) protein
MTRHEIQRQLNAIDDLPTLPAIAMTLNRMLQDIETPIEKMVALLETDQALTIRLLRLVNSSFYGFKSRIASLQHAITLMGYSTVQNAVVNISVIECLETESAPQGFDPADFWVHSIGVACMSRFLAARTKLAAPDEAFTAGLIHDIGKIILVNHFPEVFTALVEVVAAEKVSFHEAEKRSDTLPHHLIGSHLGKHWMLPMSLEAAIRHHHNSSGRSEDLVLADIVAVADLLVHLFDHTPGHRFQRGALPGAIRDPVITLLRETRRWLPEIQAATTKACEFFDKG